MSLRRPTAAVLLFTFNISPFCDVTPTSDCGISFKALSVMSPRRSTVAFLLKPFLWCRPDVRLWHFFLSPLCGVTKTPDCGIIFLYLFVHLSRRRFRHPIGNYLCSVGISGGLPPFPFYWPCYDNFECTLVNLFMTHPCMHLLYLTSKLSCEYFQSTHWLVDLARCWRRRSHGWRIW